MSTYIFFDLPFWAPRSAFLVMNHAGNAGKPPSGHAWRWLRLRPNLDELDFARRARDSIHASVLLGSLCSTVLKRVSFEPRVSRGHVRSL